MFKSIIIFFSMLLAIGCKTIEPKKEEIVEIPKKESKIKVIDYGVDSEIQSVNINGNKYYILGSDKNIENMTEEEVKSLSLVAPLIVSEESIKGIDGIVIKYYDIKIFLSEKNILGSTKVGLFEPQNRAWTIGEDKDRTKNIQLQLNNSIAGINIKRGSISLSYR